MLSSLQPLEPEDLTSIDDLLKRIGKDKRLQVVMYTATWCSPCKSIKKKIYDKETKTGLSKIYGDDIRFIYVDIDKNRELADEFKITSIPHFYLMKSGGEMLCNFKGGNNLEEKIREYIR